MNQTHGHNKALIYKLYWCLMQGFWQCAVVQDCTIWSNPHNIAQFLHNIEKWALEFLENYKRFTLHNHFRRFVALFKPFPFCKHFFFASINNFWRILIYKAFFFLLLNVMWLQSNQWVPTILEKNSSCITL